MHVFDLDGTEHEIWLTRPNGEYQLVVDGKPLAVEMTPHSNHAYELVVQGKRSRVFVAQDGDEIFVHLDGETHGLHYLDSLSRFADEAQEEGEAVARAPMPGTVIAVSAQPGEQVQRGQPLMVIESMKMETTIGAACDGVVRSFHVNVGETFDRDDVLVTLDREATK